MAALFPNDLQTTPSSDLREAGSSPREVGIRLVSMLLGMSALLLFAGWILLESTSGLQPGDALPGARPEGVIAPPGPPQAWGAGAAELPRNWTWERPAIRFDTMYRELR
jgi:hypothetical protein